MFKSFIRTAIRNLLKQARFTLINISGLSIGIATSLIIFLYVINETTYDKHIPNYENIYRIGVKGKFAGSPLDMAVTSAPMAEAMRNDYPEVEVITRIRPTGRVLVVKGDVSYYENGNITYADSTLFKVFPYQMLQGDPDKALSKPNSLVLTESAAKKYFGNEDPMGKTLEIDTEGNLFRITGVMEDCPENTHWHFTMLASLVSLPYSQNQNWMAHNLYTYFILNEQSDPQAFNEKINGMIPKYVGPLIQQILGVPMEDFLKQGNSFGYDLTRLDEIHLTSNRQYEIETNGNPRYVSIFSIIAVLILLISCINFINLSTARSTRRSREVILRKVLGSTKRVLISQYLLESLLISFLSTLFAVILVLIGLPWFNDLLNINLSLELFKNAAVIPLILLFAIGVGLLSGTYPSWLIASFRNIGALKGDAVSGMKSGRFRSFLVIGQFAVTMIILSSTFLVNRQLRFMQNKSLGFTKENILVINNPEALRGQFEAFRQEVEKLPAVESAAQTYRVPGIMYSNNAHFLEETKEDELLLLMQNNASPGFAEIMEYELVEGRFFDRNVASDSFAIVINEAAVKAFGIEKPLETRFYFPGESRPEETFRPIIGVVKDFHYESMYEKINPVALHYLQDQNGTYIVLRYKEGTEASVIPAVESIWSEFNDRYPFDYEFLEDIFMNLFEGERQTALILLVFSILSIIISGLGLYGLISYTTTQRVTEIGIRKALGSSVDGVVKLLSMEVIRLLAFSTLLALPVFFLIKKWLTGFAYHIPFNPIIYMAVVLITGIAVLLLALSTLTTQSYRAALANPAQSLREE